MAQKMDNIHYNWRSISGYNKAFNFVMSPRELGKTTTMWYQMIYLPFKKDHKPWIYFVRQIVEITDAMIDSIFDAIIHKFSDDDVYPTYKVGSFKDGIVDVFLNERTHDAEGNEVIQKYLFFRIVSLSIHLRRIKLAVLRDIKGVFMDEYIIDPRSGEKYQENEAFKIKEAYTTWSRESIGMLKFYFSGNPYSLFNPLFVEWNVDTLKLRKGEFYVGDVFVIHWPMLNPELKEKILEKNPLYVFDEDYNQYALEGTAINDRNIRLAKLPQNYFLNFVFILHGKYIGIYKNQYMEDMEERYFCKFLDSVGAKRTAYAFDFEDLLTRTAIVGKEERTRVQHFKNAMRKNSVQFEDINVYYYIVEIYKNI